MAERKIEKALYGPSTFEVAVGAILGFAVGVVAACVYLVFKPVIRTPQMPKEPVAHTVYLVPGNENSTKAKAWQAKQKAFLTGSEVSLNEEELNAWAATIGTPAQNTPAPKPGPKPAAKPPATEKDKDKPAENQPFFSASAPNFRIISDKLQISAKCTLNYYGIATDVWVVATGRFERSGDHYRFDPETFYFGSCPMHKLPALGAIARTQLLDTQKVPDDFRAAWAKVTAISIEGGLMKVATAQ
ncbi:MAG TPA: hypothetical protein VFJ90_07900 [Candidatus Didemnitutus sp.]|nr:hypothetical protein [Candidatus Didemnitutus sp.]